jgi:type I restriction enzyme, S subunit
VTSGKVRSKGRGWRSARFGDLVENVNVSVQDPEAAGIERAVGLEDLDSGSTRLRRWRPVTPGISFKRRFLPGQVLFSKRRVYLRKAAVAEFDGVCSGDLLVFQAKGELEPALLPFLVQCDAFVEHALETSAGSLSPRTKWSALQTLEFSLPPKEEQSRLIKLLKSALAHVEALEGVEAAARVAAAALFEAEVDDMGGDIVPLAKVFPSSPESGCSAPERDEDTGHYVLGLQALSRYGYVPGQFKSVDATPKMLKARLKPGDLLVSRSNTLERVGFAGIFDEDRADVSFPDTIMRLQIDEKQVLPRYMMKMLMSRRGRRHMRRVAAGTSASLKKINRKSLGAFEFPLPSVEKQIEAMSRIDRVERLVLRAGAARRSAAELGERLREEILGDALF